jgi:hypothetical protein
VKKSSKLRDLFDERVKRFYDDIGNILEKHGKTTHPFENIKSEADDIIMKEAEYSERSQDYFPASLEPVTSINGVKPTSEPLPKETKPTSLEVSLGEYFVNPGAEVKSMSSDAERIAGTNFSSTV